MKERFKDIKVTGDIVIKMDEVKGVWRAKKAYILKQIISVCEEYIKEGYSLTLRQLYYQLVSRDIIPNHDKVYKKISKLKDDGVYSGLIDWDVFEDRGRVPSVPYSEEGVKEALEYTVKCYRLARQRNQKNHIEVWTEKDAISSILKRVTSTFGVTLVVNKGYTSSTAIYGAYCRFSEALNEGRKVKVLYFGDHDPSGLDMIRDIRERLMFMFLNGDGLDGEFMELVYKHWESQGLNIWDVVEWGEKYDDVGKLMGEDITEEKREKLQNLFEECQKLIYIEQNNLFEVVQVGLTMEQIKEYNPPSNPAKMTDPRMAKYIRKFGKVSWEVDALKPRVMEDIVKEAIEVNIDMEAFNILMKEEREDKIKISNIIKGLQ